MSRFGTSRPTNTSNNHYNARHNTTSSSRSYNSQPPLLPSSSSPPHHAPTQTPHFSSTPSQIDPSSLPPHTFLICGLCKLSNANLYCPRCMAHLLLKLRIQSSQTLISIDSFESSLSTLSPDLRNKLSKANVSSPHNCDSPYTPQAAANASSSSPQATSLAIKRLRARVEVLHNKKQSIAAATRDCKIKTTQTRAQLHGLRDAISTSTNYMDKSTSTMTATPKTIDYSSIPSPVPQSTPKSHPQRLSSIDAESTRACNTLFHIFNIVQRRRRDHVSVKSRSNHHKSASGPTVYTYICNCVVPSVLALSDYQLLTAAAAIDRIAYLTQYLAAYLRVPLPYPIGLPTRGRPFALIGIPGISSSSPSASSSQHRHHKPSSGANGSSSAGYSNSRAGMPLARASALAEEAGQVPLSGEKIMYGPVSGVGMVAAATAAARACVNSNRTGSSSPKSYRHNGSSSSANTNGSTNDSHISTSQDAVEFCRSASALAMLCLDLAYLAALVGISVDYPSPQSATRRSRKLMVLSETKDVDGDYEEEQPEEESEEEPEKIGAKGRPIGASAKQKSVDEDDEDYYGELIDEFDDNSSSTSETNKKLNLNHEEPSTEPLPVFEDDIDDDDTGAVLVGGPPSLNASAAKASSASTAPSWTADEKPALANEALKPHKRYRHDHHHGTTTTPTHKSKLAKNMTHKHAAPGVSSPMPGAPRSLAKDKEKRKPSGAAASASTNKPVNILHLGDMLIALKRALTRPDTQPPEPRTPQHLSEPVVLKKAHALRIGTTPPPTYQPAPSAQHQPASPVPRRLSTHQNRPLSRGTTPRSPPAPESSPTVQWPSVCELRNAIIEHNQDEYFDQESGLVSTGWNIVSHRN